MRSVHYKGMFRTALQTLLRSNSIKNLSLWTQLHLFSSNRVHRVETVWLKHVERSCKMWNMTNFSPKHPLRLRKNFQDFPSYRIFIRLHGALNIIRNKNNCTIYL